MVSLYVNFGFYFSYSKTKIGLDKMEKHVLTTSNNSLNNKKRNLCIKDQSLNLRFNLLDID